MTLNRKVIQLSLISVGIFLILATYFFYPKFIESRVIKGTVKEYVIETGKDTTNTFENVEYKGTYDIDKTFKVTAEKAHVLTDNPDVVFLTEMKVVLKMLDETTWVIVSDKGSYNKITYDCFFEDNVKATDGKTTIFSDNVDLVTSKDFISVYNNVYLLNKESHVKADKIDYDLTKKLYKISMFQDKQYKKVRIKLVE